MRAAAASVAGTALVALAGAARGCYPAPAMMHPPAALAATLLAAVLALVPAAPAHADREAAPAGADDGLLQLLHERGLLASTDAAAPARTLRLQDHATELVLSALQHVGVPYRRGGSDAAEGFDCSGFTRHVFAHTLGLLLPRRADEQARQPDLQPVRPDELRPGDLVFFNTLRRAFSHVGIYVGDGRFVHAPRSGAEVRLEDMRGRYWSRRFDGARRAAHAAAGATPAR